MLITIRYSLMSSFDRSLIIYFLFILFFFRISMLRKRSFNRCLLCLLPLIIGAILFTKFYKLPVDEQKSDTSQLPPPLYPYIAVIIDSRATSQLVTAVLNILQHIPADWKVQIFTLDEHWPFYEKTSLQPFIKNERVFMTPIDFPKNNLPDQDYINLYLTSPSLWRRIRGEKVLYFQTDSAICSNSSYKLTDFLHYDFIGAPWKEGGCCNGGFSIRSRTKTLLFLESNRPPFPLHEINEDGWFVNNFRRFGGFVAPVSVAKTFSMESIYHPGVFAVHRSRDARPEKEDVLRTCAECPEARTIFYEC